MILDYNYDKNKKSLYLSYINDDGRKKILDFNVNKFKTYAYKMDGEYDTWDGHKASESYTYNPSNFDIKRFILDLPEKYKKLISKRTFPKVYTFDIETEVTDEFPEPSLAKQRITTISICSPECNTIVLGTRVVSDEDKQWMGKSFNEYVNSTKFFGTLGLEKPTFKYITFASEKEMLEYFLKNIVAKVPILTGWNSILFDWQYITTRIRNEYPQLSIKLSSCIGGCNMKSYLNWRNERVKLMMPQHTLILDMMEVLKDDYVVLPIKESMSLDYIAYESLGINKIKYDGTLQELYENDYNKYVFYNAIDSFLVQLINYRFKTLNIFYLYSLYCTEKIGSCFSKVLLTEALAFNYFYKNNLKVVWEEHHPTKSKLLGAYVKVPTPGIHDFVCCNDFASLYPSTIITCNLSFENLVAICYDEEKLKPYRNNPDKYTIICSSVYTNDDDKKLIGTFINEEKLKPYRNNPDYFISVYGHVYKNDKDYAFRSIQKELKAERNKSKYLAKKLDATCVRDIELVLKGREVGKEQYEDNIVQALKNNNIYNINTPQDWKSLSKEELESHKKELTSYIEYLTIDEQSKKLMGNSMYGGSSKESFFWYNMELANDITGESKNLIHMMESHLSNYWSENWGLMKEYHDKWNINIKNNWRELLNNWIPTVYGDTDSLYLKYDKLLETIEGVEQWDNKKKLDFILKLNLEFLNDHNKQFMDEYYAKRYAKSIHEFELETVALAGVWLNVKKRYAQILLWKDGKFFDEDDLPMKVKGLEVVKSSVPKLGRSSLKDLIRYLILNGNDKYIIHKLNMKVQEERQRFNTADIEDICGSSQVNNYNKYISNDEDKDGLKVELKCPYNVRAVGNYNWIRNKYKLDGEPIYDGKVKYYIYNVPNSNRTDYFAFQGRKYPEWADKYAPINRKLMFEKFVLDAFNRILEAININKLNVDGSIQTTLF